MKVILLIVLAAGATLLTGCETVAVVDRRPVYGSTEVYYSSGRPYYYTGGSRYWGYPRGYSGYRGGNHDYDHHSHYSRNVEVERNTYVVNNRNVYRGNHDRPAQYRSNNVSHTSTVKVQPYPQHHGKKKKKKD